jgi:hypothetical protein
MKIKMNLTNDGSGELLSRHPTPSEDENASRSGVKGAQHDAVPPLRLRNTPENTIVPSPIERRGETGPADGQGRNNGSYSSTNVTVSAMPARVVR